VASYKLHTLKRFNSRPTFRPSSWLCITAKYNIRRNADRRNILQSFVFREVYHESNSSEYLLTLILTYTMKRVLLEKITGLQLVKKFRVFY
jgi:hypothetical protein